MIKTATENGKRWRHYFYKKFFWQNEFFMIFRLCERPKNMAISSRPTGQLTNPKQNQKPLLGHF